MIEIFIKDNSIFQSASKDHIHYSQVNQRDRKIILVEEKLTLNQLEHRTRFYGPAVPSQMHPEP